MTSLLIDVIYNYMVNVPKKVIVVSVRKTYSNRDYAISCAGHILSADSG